MPYWVENVNSKGVVVGPYNSAPTGMNLTTLIGYPTQAQAQAAANQLSTLPTKITGAVNAVGSSVVNDALKPLFNANIWLRVAEVIAGLLLVAIGVAELTKAIPVATKIAGMVK